MARRAIFVAVLLLALGVAAACSSGGSSNKTPPDVITAIATRDEANKAPGLTSTIEVTFNRDIKLASEKVPLASNFELKIPHPGATKTTQKTVLVKAAKVKDGSTRVIVLNVAALIPDGSTLTIQQKAFVEKSTETATVVVSSELDAIQALLASEALVLTDPTVLDTSKPAVATDADRDPAAMRAALDAHMTKVGATGQETTDALAAYDAIPDTIVTSPKAKAAIAALRGTFAEPAIASLLTSANCTGKPAARIAFEVPPDNPDLFARVTYADNGARIISLNPSIEGEPLELLMPIIAHESIHCDRQSGRFEEVAATAMDSFFYIEELSAMPELAQGQTVLTREFNVDAIALINSGRTLPESIGILPSPGVKQVLPGTNDESPSFADLVAAAYPGVNYNESPDEPLAQAYVTNLAGRIDASVASAFNLLYLDELLARVITAEELGNAISALGLAPAS